MSQRKPLTIAGVVVLTLAVGLGLYLFQPWALFTNKQVNEALPSAVASPSGSKAGSAEQAPPAGPVVLASGSFVSFEHDTSGQASLIQAPDKSQILRLSDFETSNGPDVKVWLSTNPASQAADARSGKYVDLGELKGNIGNQNYTLPTAAQGTRWKSVVIWCDRFSVPFGAATLV